MADFLFIAVFLQPLRGGNPEKQIDRLFGLSRVSSQGHFDDDIEVCGDKQGRRYNCDSPRSAGDGSCPEARDGGVRTLVLPFIPDPGTSKASCVSFRRTRCQTVGSFVGVDDSEEWLCGFCNSVCH